MVRPLHHSTTHTLPRRLRLMNKLLLSTETQCRQPNSLIINLSDASLATLALYCARWTDSHFAAVLALSADLAKACGYCSCCRMHVATRTHTHTQPTMCYSPSMLYHIIKGAGTCALTLGCRATHTSDCCGQMKLKRSHITPAQHNTALCAG